MVVKSTQCRCQAGRSAVDVGLRHCTAFYTVQQRQISITALVAGCGAWWSVATHTHTHTHTHTSASRQLTGDTTADQTREARCVAASLSTGGTDDQH